MRWARAGHLPPVLLPEGKARTLPQPAGVLLGAVDHADYAEEQAELAPGDTLVMYTDGLIERHDESVQASLAGLLSLSGPAAALPGDGRPAVEGRLDHLLRHSGADDDTCLSGSGPAVREAHRPHTAAFTRPSRHRGEWVGPERVAGPSHRIRPRKRDDMPAMSDLLSRDARPYEQTTPAAAAPSISRPAVPELVSVTDPQKVAPADARELTRVLLTRLSTLEEGTREYSYVRSTLVELNLSLVRFALRRFTSHRESTADLLQVGAVGLIKAIDRFDPERGVEFTTYALPTILGEIRRHFRDTTWAVHVPRRLQELRITLAKAQDELSQGLDRAPTVEELARHLDLPAEEVVEGLVATNAHTTDSIDLPASGEKGAAPLADLIGGPDDRLDLVENMVALKPLIAALPERDRLILSLRFTQELTQSQIGARLGLSQMHVSRLLARTLKTLREGLDGPA
ncbi:hypothetical protein GCM10009760_49790 [Kitasatospora kazusensis]|uniref:RNA polymerase sigma-70 domain-containing protein n=1 Tax=Kitasatospora kazusensis TaxID=407974 RepID=A0ABN3A2S0_9ACTN